MSTKFNCRRISVILYRSASGKLAVDSPVLLVCGLSLIRPQRERIKKGVWQIASNQRFVNSCLANSSSVFIYTQLYAPYNFICA